MGIFSKIGEVLSSMGGGGQDAEKTEAPAQEVATVDPAPVQTQTPMPDVQRQAMEDIYPPTISVEPEQAKVKMPEPEQAFEKVKSGKLAVRKTREAAESDFIGSIKKWENPDDEGLVGKGSNAMYTKIRSKEGNAGNPKHTEFEIGAGIKILTKWKSRNPKDWPKISGVPVDVYGKGLTPMQLKEFTGQIANSSIKAVSKIPGYDKMSEAGKMYWADMVYNAGAGSPAMNPNAMKAMKKGHTVEGIVKTFDFVSTTIGGKKVGMRGLLRRRLSRYNDVADSEPGVPTVVGYKWAQDGVMVKFDYPGFMTDKVSPEFNKRIDEDGWMKVKIKNVSANPKDKDKVYKDF